MAKALDHHLDPDDVRVIAWSFCAASTLAMVPALWFDWFLVDGIVNDLRTNLNVAGEALSVDLLPWAGAFTFIVSSCAAFGVWLATRPTRSTADTNAFGILTSGTDQGGDGAPQQSWRPRVIVPLRQSGPADRPACAA